MQAQQGPAAAPLIAAAGTDISHWCALIPYPARATFSRFAAEALLLDRFDAKTGDVKLFVDPLTNVASAYCPQVRKSWES